MCVWVATLRVEISRNTNVNTAEYKNSLKMNTLGKIHSLFTSWFFNYYPFGSPPLDLYLPEFWPKFIFIHFWDVLSQCDRENHVKKLYKSVENHVVK